MPDHAHDANGNMTVRIASGNAYLQSWDVENRLLTVARGATTTSFKYDGDSKLVRVAVGATVTALVGNWYEWSSSATSYYYFGSQRVAMRVGANVTYIHGDQLGSATNTTDPLSSQRYYPFGQTRGTGTVGTNYRFTGQRWQDDVKLYYYNARWYHAGLGRFVSADSIVPGPGNPQSLNRYSYCLNNPLKYVDPTGKFTEEELRAWGISAEMIAKWKQDHAWWAFISFAQLYDIFQATSERGFIPVGVSGIFVLERGFGDPAHPLTWMPDRLVAKGYDGDLEHLRRWTSDDRTLWRQDTEKQWQQVEWAYYDTRPANYRLNHGAIGRTAVDMAGLGIAVGVAFASPEAAVVLNSVGQSISIATLLYDVDLLISGKGSGQAVAVDVGGLYPPVSIPSMLVGLLLDVQSLVEEW